MEEITYIIGHRNPDADAICSAIGYAAYKTACGQSGFEPARCGNTNARIDAILNRFQQPVPRFLGDVTPRVRDIMTRNIHFIHPFNTCAEALQKIDAHDIRVLPVIEEDRTLLGTLTIFQLGEYFIPKPRGAKNVRHVFTSIGDIVRSLGAQEIYLHQPDRLEDLYVRIGAMDIRTFGSFTHEEPTLAEQSIIVVGDRYDIQTKSIHAGVRLLVITGGLPCEEEIKAMARERNVSLIISPFDSATTSWVIRTANRVDNVFEPRYMSFSPEEKLGIVRRKIAAQAAAAYMVIDEEKHLTGLFTKSDILKPASTRLILVDHNELSQAVPGADQVQITEIIDHHRLGNPPSQQPILFFNEPVGSTCTIVADLFRRNQKTPPGNIAGILMSGIIADTLNLNSPTCTRKDEEILGWLESIAGTTQAELAEMIFSSGSIILSNPPDQVVRSDLKVYHHGPVRYAVSQVEELGFDNFWKHRPHLSKALSTTVSSEDLLFAALLVTDINTQNSLLLLEGNAEVLGGISYPKVENREVFELAGVVSRKKQLIPYLTSLLTSLGHDQQAS